MQSAQVVYIKKSKKKGGTEPCQQIDNHENDDVMGILGSPSSQAALAYVTKR